MSIEGQRRHNNTQDLQVVESAEEAPIAVRTKSQEVVMRPAFPIQRGEEEAEGAKVR